MSDRLIRATAAGGGIRAVGVITTNLTETARVRHRLSAVSTDALGRGMAAGLLLSSGMKTKFARVNLRIKGNGPIGGLMVDAGVDGTVRGYVNHPHVEVPLTADGKLDVGGAIGQAGFVYVFRDLGYGRPYSSTVELVSGEIGDDVANYLFSSEQTPSALVLGVSMNSHSVQSAGGILIQVLPKAARDESLVTLLETRVSGLQGFTPLLKAGMDLPDIFEELLGDLGLTIFPEERELKFDCPCTEQRMLGALKLLGKDELEDMIATDKGAEAVCDFCGEIYHVSEEKLANLVGELQVQN
ncbi:Hsp33 family molecular chaperone HslO [Chamaesiphon sp.]|uniref:Hsp33 family molecular chaperone HslO n=1 Tax=Chamaesiphon sp. TaxID=2814140 RepID=UPI003593C156